MRKIIISHPTGNENVHSLLYGLYKNNILECFQTCIAIYKEGFIYKLLKRRGIKKQLSALVHTHPYTELGRLICSKWNIPFLTKHESGIFCIDKVYRNLDKKVAQYIANNSSNIQGIYAYEDGALSSFQVAKQHGIYCLYDLPIGYWRSMRGLLSIEKNKKPEWASTIIGFLDSANKLQRKEEELRLADHIFVASNFTKETLINYCPFPLNGIDVIPYGFPTINRNRTYMPFNGRKIKALFIGELSQRKGLSYLFESIQGLEEHIELTVIGKGNINGCPVLKEALKKVNYIPSLPHDEVLRCMAEHDVFIFPSLFEGFGLVITEAMSQGTPVITTERTCAPDLITHDKDGWIVKAGETAPIRELLEKFIQHPEILQTVGKEAMKTASKRPWNCYENELIASIKTTLNIA